MAEEEKKKWKNEKSARKDHRREYRFKEGEKIRSKTEIRLKVR